MLCAVLAGCATAPPRLPALDAAQQRAALLEFPGFALAGKVVIADRSSGRGQQGSLDWQQDSDITKVCLSGLIGCVVEVEYGTGRLVLADGNRKITDDEARRLLAEELGFVPPFDELRYWILGLPAPGSTASETANAEGLPETLEQQGWLIRYNGHMPVEIGAGRMRLPKELVATRGDLRLKLVISKWRRK